jgi:hypothetical protein
MRLIFASRWVASALTVRLGQPRQAFQQQMPVGQQAKEDLPNDLILAEHGFGDACLQGVEVGECGHGTVLGGRSRKTPGSC